MSREYIITGIQPHNIMGVWETVENWIDDASKADDESSLNEIQDKLKAGKMQLWVVLQLPLFVPVACYVTEVELSPTQAILNTAYLGGDDIDEWLPLVESTIQQFAESLGCGKLTLRGRRGWVKKLREFGWTEELVVMNKELVNG